MLSDSEGEKTPPLLKIDASGFCLTFVNPRAPAALGEKLLE
jgi:hypothetical protein